VGGNEKNLAPEETGPPMLIEKESRLPDPVRKTSDVLGFRLTTGWRIKALPPEEEAPSGSSRHGKKGTLWTIRSQTARVKADSCLPKGEGLSFLAFGQAALGVKIFAANRQRKWEKKNLYVKSFKNVDGN